MLSDPRPYFAELPDPRRETRNKLHKLNDILMLVCCAVLSGIEDWVGMEEFGKQKEDWLREFLELPNGIPSHDTLSDVLGRLAPGAFTDALLRWVEVAIPSLAGEPVCLDGKRLRGSRVGEQAVHLVSAYAAKARLEAVGKPLIERFRSILNQRISLRARVFSNSLLVLTPQAVADKTNEITLTMSH